MFFDDWQSIWRVIAVGVPAYLLLIVLLLASGKRTLSKMNAFDLVVTVAIGSTLATILLSADVALAEGITALALLIFLQLIITWLSVRSEKARRLVKEEPTLLYHGGQFLRNNMKQERITEEELLQAVRAQGNGSMEQVEAIVLETDGHVSVIGNTGAHAPSALANVRSTT